jgi:hypothetical protein
LQDAIYQLGNSKNYELTQAGGSDKMKYSMSGGYLSQKGIVVSTGYEAFNFRIKTDYTKKGG